MSFAEMAVELRCAASREAFSIGTLEIFEARYPNGLMAGTLDEVRRTASAFGEMHALMRSLVPYEAEVRAMLARPPGQPVQQPKEKLMLNDTKSVLLSKGVWGGIVAVGAGAAGLFGYSVSPADQAAIADLAMQTILLATSISSVGGGLLAIVGRVKATKRIR